MRKLHIPFFILAIVVPLTISSFAWAETKTPTPGALARLVCQALEDKCIGNCGSGPDFNSCHDKCVLKSVSCLYPAVVGGGGAVKTGKPVQAPPPPKGGKTPPRHHKPVNAAPIINGKPVQAPPGTGETHPILEKGSGGGGGKLK